MLKIIRSHPLTSTVSVLFMLMLGWHWLGYPSSLDEAFFLRKIASLNASEANELNLAELMPGDWEMVCESHGYDGPLYLERYNRTYEPVAPPQDATWGLIFISKDGSFKSAVGSCRVPGLMLYTNGCKERSKAILKRIEQPQCHKFAVSKQPAS